MPGQGITVHRGRRQRIPGGARLRLGSEGSVGINEEKPRTRRDTWALAEELDFQKGKKRNYTVERETVTEKNVQSADTSSDTYVSIYIYTYMYSHTHARLVYPSSCCICASNITLVTSYSYLKLICKHPGTLQSLSNSPHFATTPMPPRDLLVGHTSVRSNRVPFKGSIRATIRDL